MSRSTAPPFVQVGILAALVLPFLVFSTASSDALRESKLLVQALGASLALFGLARGGTIPTLGRGRAARVAVLGLLTTLALALLSAFANAGVVDPLAAAAVLSPLALLLAGSSAAGARAAPVAAYALMAAGAFTGALAAVQRWTGVFRLPLEAPEPRFLAAALIGNAGDVGMALVVPSVLLFASVAGSHVSARGRMLAAASLAPALLGLLATESVWPALAFGGGAAVFAALDLRRRGLAMGLLLVAAACLAAATGAGQRFLMKLDELRRGDLAAATTQRDIGLYAAREMILQSPVLGVGPGAFSNRFVRARLAAEERTRRRLVHSSGSAHFDNAHSEPVTLAAEIGLPAALTAAAAALALLAGLLTQRRIEPSPPPGASVHALFAVLFAVALLGLGDFPLRIAVTSGPAAFLAGVALRRASGGDETPASTARGSGALFVTLGLLIAALAAVRSFATLAQAQGESLLLGAASAPEDAATERAELLSAAGARLGKAVALRPRSATALLALGSVDALRGERESAYAVYARSLKLEERAESDLNLGRAALSLRRADEAHGLFRRAVWIQPRLLNSLPAEVDRERLAAEIDAAEQALLRGGRAPALPVLR